MFKSNKVSRKRITKSPVGLQLDFPKDKTKQC